jgi:hypothetical protein
MQCVHLSFLRMVVLSIQFMDRDAFIASLETSLFSLII